MNHTSEPSVKECTEQPVLGPIPTAINNIEDALANVTARVHDLQTRLHGVTDHREDPTGTQPDYEAGEPSSPIHGKLEVILANLKNLSNLVYRIESKLTI